MTRCEPPGAWPEDELESLLECPVCGSPKRQLLHRSIFDRAFNSAPGKWDLYSCHNCGSAYLNPRPIESSIWRAYSKYYTHGSTDAEPLSTDLSFRKLIRRSLRNGYINSRYGSNLAPAYGMGRWIIPLLYLKQGQIDYGLRNLPRLSNRESFKLLDIGAGNGTFLRESLGLGWGVQGIDPDSKAASQNTDLQVDVGGLPKTGFPDDSFDVVTLSHVIEHTHDPLSSLREVRRILKPGGRIWIATPNLTSASHLLFRDNWIGLHPPNHLVLFSHKSMFHALNAAGFNSLRVEKMHPQAGGYHHMSQRIELGEDPFSPQGSPLKFALRLRGMLDDFLSIFLIDRREEIVVTAKKPMRDGSGAAPVDHD